MNCPYCGEASKRFGKTRDGQQRHRCSDLQPDIQSEPKPLAGLATDLKTAAFALNMLLEGTPRPGDGPAHRPRQEHDPAAHGPSRPPVLPLPRRLDAEPSRRPTFSGRSLVVCRLQRKNRVLSAFRGRIRRCLSFSLRSSGITKLLFCFHVGRRTGEDAALFADKLALCMARRISAARLDGRLQSVPHRDSSRVRSSTSTTEC